MAQKSALKKRPEPRKPQAMPKPSDLPEFDPPEEELTAGEQLLEKIKPHITTLALIMVAVVLGVIALGMFSTAADRTTGVKWQELVQSSIVDQQTGDTKNLDGISNQYPNETVGLFSALLSGDIELRKGLRLLPRDAEAGLTAIRKAKNSFQLIVDANDSIKSELLSQRSQYCLAYSLESLGELEKAKTLYQQFVDAAPEAPLAESARRGVQRCGDADMVALYQTFANFEEEVIGEAPGPSVPETESAGTFPVVDGEAGTVPPQGDETDTRMQADAIAEEKAKMEAEAKAKAEADAKAKMEAEAKAKGEAEAKAKMEAEAAAKAEQEAAAKTEVDSEAKPETDETQAGEAPAADESVEADTTSDDGV